MLSHREPQLKGVLKNIRALDQTSEPPCYQIPHSGLVQSAYCGAPQYAEFERELIRERSLAGLKRYRGLYGAGKVGKEVHSRSGKDLPVGRPKRIFNPQQVIEVRNHHR
jgi:hypothetical protein